MARKPAILFDCTRCFNSNAVQHAKFLIEISSELSARARGGREESFFPRSAEGRVHQLPVPATCN